MKLKKIALLWVFLLVVAIPLVSSVQAVSQFVDVTVAVNVYVDDAFIWRANWVYGYSDWKQFAYVIVSMGTDPFYRYYNIEMKIAGYCIWNPPENLSAYGPLWGDGIIRYMNEHFSQQSADAPSKAMFIFLTGGDLWCYDKYGRMDYRLLGCCSTKQDGSEWWFGSVAAEISTWVVQHEVSHLYGTDDHYLAINCVMSYYIDSREWCQDCQNTIWSNKFRFGFIPRQYRGAIPLTVEGEVA